MEYQYSSFYRPHLRGAIQSNGSQAYGFCPLHSDKIRSFSVNLETGQWMCHAEHESGNAITFARRLGLEPPSRDSGAFPPGLGPRSTFDNNRTPPPSKPSGRPEPRRVSPAPEGPRKLVEQYVYKDEAGQPLFRVNRFDPKGFTQERWEDEQWRSGTKGIRRVLYHLPQIVAAPTNTLIYLVEGEKDVHRLESLGLVATTSPMGANSWTKEYAEPLRKRYVAIIPDNDEPGKDFARKAAGDIKEVGGSTKIVQLENIPDKGDVSDYLDRPGNQQNALMVLVRQTPLFGEVRVPNEDPGTYFSKHNLDIHDGALLLPREYQQYASDAIREVIHHCDSAIPEGISKKLDEVDLIAKSVRTKGQYGRILKLLMEVHVYSTAA